MRAVKLRNRRLSAWKSRTLCFMSLVVNQHLIAGGFQLQCHKEVKKRQGGVNHTGSRGRVSLCVQESTTQHQIRHRQRSHEMSQMSNAV